MSPRSRLGRRHGASSCFIARFLAVAVTAGAMALQALPAVAATIETDLFVYNNGDTVIVTGVEYGANETVEVVTTAPSGSEVDRGTAETDAGGSFQYAFVLNSEETGLFDVAGTGLTSGLTATTQFDPPNAPTTLHFTDRRYTTTGVDLSWTAPSGGQPPVCYYVYRSTLPITVSSGGSTCSGALPSGVIAIVTAPTVSFTDATAVGGTQYYYRVTSVRTSNPASGESSLSNQVATNELNNVTSVSFPSTNVGSNNSVTSTFTNNSGATVTYQGAGISGGNAGDFSVTSQPALGASIANGATYNVTVQFSPGATGSRSSVLGVSVASTSSALDQRLIPLTGTGTAANNPPDTSITANPPATSNSSSASFSFTGSDDLTPPGSLTFECKLDGGSFASCSSPKNYSGLAEGSHTFQVRAVDASAAVDASPASYTWTVDTISPDTAITTNPSDPSGSSSASFSFTGSDPGGSGVASFGCRLDGGSFSPCTSPQGYSGLSDGSHTFEVRAVDNAGNADESPASYAWVVDTAAPNVTIDTVSDDLLNAFETSTDITWHADENGTYRVRLGDCGSGTILAGPAAYSTSPGTVTSTVDASDLAEGENTIKVCVVDAVSNVGSASTSVTKDTQAPDAPDMPDLDPTSDSGASDSDDVTNDATPTIRGGPGSVEADATVEVFVDGPSVGTTAAANDGSWSLTVGSTLADGDRDVTATATDAAGNTSTESDTLTITVDTTDPDTSILTGPDDPTNSTSATFTFDGADSGGSGVDSFACQLDGAGYSTCASPQGYLALGDGSHTVDVRATDRAGNTDPTPATQTWTIDTVAPETTITSQPDDPSGSDSTAFEFTGDDGSSGTGIAGFRCQVDGGGFVACTSGVSYSGLTDGSHTFEVYAIDNAGNEDETPDSFTWLVDTTAPSASASAPTYDNTGTITVSWSANDVGAGLAGIDLYIRGPGEAAFSLSDSQSAAGVTDTGTFSVTATTEGTYEVYTRATDAVGNTEDAPATADDSTLEDRTEPTVTIDDGPDDPTNQTSATFQFTPSDDAAGVASTECRLDGGFWWSCTSGVSYSSLADGSHTFEVRATDNAGNQQSTPTSFTWVVDTADPDTVIDTTPDDPTSATGATFTFHGADPGGSGVASFECNLDAGAWSTCTSPKSYSGLSDGSHTFEVRAIDGAGNVDATPASFGWFVDTVDPLITFVDRTAPNAAGWNKTDVTANWSCSDPGGSGVLSSTATQTLTSEGASQSATGTCTDNAGNSASDTQTGIKIDKTAPTVTVTGVTNGATYTLGSVPAAGCSTADGLSGVAVNATLGAVGGLVGPVTVTCSGGKDNADNVRAPVSVTYQVNYAFSGFFRPIDNSTAATTVLNSVNSGQAVPVKFSLGGNQGMAIFAAGFPQMHPIDCTTGDEVDPIEQTVTAGGSSLSYDTSANQYVYVWKTQKAWSGTCGRLDVKLADGTMHSAYFKFTK